MRVQLTFLKERPLPLPSSKDLRKIIKKTCETAEPKVFLRSLVVTLEVVSVSDDTIQEINRRYRKKDRSTDVLSFGETTSLAELRNLKGNKIHLGQLFLAPDFIRRSAKEDGVSWRHEFIYVLVHGVLHLLGYDHSPRMFALQDQITEEIVSSKKKRKI